MKSKWGDRCNRLLKERQKELGGMMVEMEISLHGLYCGGYIRWVVGGTY